MPDADCRCTPRRPWSLGRGGQTPSPIKFIIRTKSPEKTLTRILADSTPIRLHSPPSLSLPLCSPDLRSYLRGGILGGRQRGRGSRKEPGPGGRGKEGRSEGSELCDTFDPLDWKMAAASLWPPPPPARALASIRLQVTRWQNRFFQTFGRAEADYADCRTKEALGFRIKGTQGR